MLPLGVSLVLAAVALHGGPRLYDDAYITFRYARNLAEGAGLVYNAGERVLGTSAPLFALLLAGLHVLTRAAIPSLAFALGVLALPATAVLGYRLARRVAGPLLAAVFVLAALSPRAALEVYASGMETPLYLLGLLAAVELACAGRDAVAFAMASALFFLHPDALVLVPAVALGLRVARGAWPWRAAAVGLLPAALAAAAVAAVYGSPLPHSVTAKRLVYAMPAGHALSRFGETVLDVVVAREIPRMELAGPFAALVLFGWALYGGRRALRELPAAALGTFSAVFLAAFGLANPLVFDWYRPPLVLGTAFVIVACASRLPKAGRAVVTGALAASAGIHLAAFQPYDPSGREEVYARAARLLDLPASATIAGPEIGALGWATRARILDTAGLVSPAALAWLGAPFGEGGAVSVRLLRETDADALVAHERFLAPTRAADPGAFLGWTEVARLPAHAFRGPGDVLVFRRARGAAVSPGP